MLVKRAEEFAKLVHRNQYYGELPYYNHLKEVYLTLLDFGVTDETVLAASWLHNSIEDYLTSSIGASTTYETLLIQFGKEVADLVLAITNEKGTNRKEILEKTAHKIVNNEAALVIKLADRIVNTEFSIDNNEKLYKMYEKEFPRFKELLFNPVVTLENVSFTLIRMWDYLENLYVSEDNRLLSGELLDISERKFNCLVDELSFKARAGTYANISSEQYERVAKELDREVYSPLEKKEISDEWAIQLTEYREELCEVEKARKEDEYWNQYNQILDERETRYYDDCYQIVEEKMYDQ